jgi:outer membrane protein OmpA-like peptidoglycan-associated protein
MSLPMSMIKYARTAAALAALVATVSCASDRKATADLVSAHTLVAQAEQSGAQQFASADIEAAREQLMALQAKQTERAMVLTLGSNVLFDTGSDVLKPGADDALNRVAQFLQGQSNVKLRIDGHTDSRGSAS